MKQNPEWQVVNKLNRSDNKTHVDRSSDSSRCLDYFITNKIQCHFRMVVDNNYEFTPYRTSEISTEQTKDTKSGRIYSDHKAIMTTFRVNDIRDKVTMKPTIVRDNKGWTNFYQQTDELADKLMGMMENGASPIKLFKYAEWGMKKAEFLSFKRIKMNKIKRKMYSDNQAFHALVHELEEQEESMKSMKVNDKIFKIRGNKIMEDRGEEMFAMFDKEGKLHETKDEVLRVLTQYNNDLLSRDEHQPDFAELHEQKKNLMKTLTNTKIEEFDTLTKADFIRAIDKIRRNKKPIFKMFLKSSHRFQAIMFFILRGIYESEEIPDSMKVTRLVALLKKGDPRDPANYRYLHLRSDLARIFEAVVYLKLEDHFATNTAEPQQGGLKECDTVENLTTLISVINQREREGSGLITNFIDAVKFFDKCFLSDTQAVLVLQNADKKAVKVLQKFQETNHIHVQGSSEEFIIKDGEGQGGISNPPRIGNALADGTERQVKQIPQEKRCTHNGEIIDTMGFVDDTGLNADNAETSNILTQAFTKTLGEISATAHPTKSKQVLFGTADWIEKTKEELTKCPSVIQGNIIGQSTQERYLGLQFPTGGVHEFNDVNIEDKCNKLRQVAFEIKQTCELPGIRRVGKLKAQAVMIMSKAVPVALYGTQCWLNLTKVQYKKMEMGFKKCIETVLSLPGSTYSALLFEISNFHMEDWIKCMKIKYFNKKLHVKKRGRLYRMLLFEIAHNIKNGFIDEIRGICKERNLPDICLTEVSNDLITRKFRLNSLEKQWAGIIKVKNLPMMINARRRRHLWHEFEESTARALQCRALNALRLRTTKKFSFHPKYQTSTGCLNWPCEFEDLESHLYECKWSGIPYVKNFMDEIRGKGEHLVKINAQRAQKYGEPLFYFGTPCDYLMSTPLDLMGDMSDDRKVAELLKEAQKLFGVEADRKDERGNAPEGQLSFINHNNNINNLTQSQRQTDKDVSLKVETGSLAVEKNMHSSMVISLKMLCHRVFVNTHDLKKKFNVKRFDIKTKSKAEFEGKSYFASSTKISCEGFFEITNKTLGNSGLVMTNQCQSRLGSWQNTAVRTKTMMHNVEEVSVPVLSPDGVTTSWPWTRIETIEANTCEERSMCSLTIESKTSGVRTDSCQAVTSVITANGEKMMKKVMESTRVYTVVKRFTSVISVEKEEEPSSSGASPDSSPPPPPPPTPESPERQDSDDSSNTSDSETSALLAASPVYINPQMSRMALSPVMRESKLDKMIQKSDEGEYSVVLSAENTQTNPNVCLEGQGSPRCDNETNNM